MQFGNNIQKFNKFGKRRLDPSEWIGDYDVTVPVISASESMIKQAKLMRDEGKHAEALSLLQLIALDGDTDSKQMAHYELALLHSQLGNQIEADRHLSSLGFILKLTNSVFAPPVNPHVIEMSKKEKLEASMRSKKSNPVVTFDDVLPANLLQPLIAAFSPSSVFWSEHEYPTQEFFSYNIRNDDNESLIKQVSEYVRPLLESHFTDLKTVFSACSVEWWCHRRDKSSAFAHQLHFDLDENALKGYKSSMKPKKVDRKFLPNSRREKGVSIRDDLHPVVSTVLYLRGKNGAPTIVTDQTLDADSVASQAWLCHPAENRLLAFDGKLLHGVVPFLPSPSAAGPTDIGDPDQYRITIMMGWWAKNFESSNAASMAPKRKGCPSLGPNMAMPSCSTQPHKAAAMKSRKVSGDCVTWPRMLAPIKLLASSNKADVSAAEQFKSVGLVHIPGPIWVPVAPSRSPLSASAPAPQNIPSDTQQKEINEKKRKKKGDAVIADTEFISIAALNMLRNAPSVGISDDEDEVEVEKVTSKISSSSGKKRSNDSKIAPGDHVVEYMSIADLNKLRDGDTSIIASAKHDAHPSITSHDGEIVFVGKWFLKSVSEIRDDVLN
jgi:hypothetical protein